MQNNRTQSTPFSIKHSILSHHQDESIVHSQNLKFLIEGKKNSIKQLFSKLTRIS
jgi:hypothetical protein